MKSLGAVTCHFWVLLDCSDVNAAQRAVLEPADAGFTEAVLAVCDIGGVIVEALTPACESLSTLKLILCSI